MKILVFYLKLDMPSELITL